MKSAKPTTRTRSADEAVGRYRYLAGGAVVLLALLLLTLPSFAADAVELGPAPTYEGSNPYTGRVSAVACSPTDPDRYFAAGADGGVWRTNDGGASWTPLTDFMPTTAMGALAIDPTDESVVYAGTGEANYANHSRYGLGLYKSTDGGDTWTQLAADVFAGRCFSKIVINPQDTQTLYASITRAGGFPELAAAKGHPGATGPVGVFRSADGGVTWTHLTTGLPALSATDLAMDPSNPNVLYAGIGRIFGHSDNGLYKTSNGGATWTKLTGGGLPGGTWGRISVAVAPSQPSRVYILITYPSTSTGGGASVLGGYRSDNGGMTWVSANPGSIQATYGWYLSIITVDPQNPDTVFMGGVTFHRSVTAGGAWSYVTPPHVDMHAADWDADGRLVVGNDGGVHRSSSLGSSWTALNEGLGAIQFYAGLSTKPTGAFILGGTQDNGSNARIAVGIWSQVFGGDGGWTQIDQASTNRMFVEYQGTGNLYRSTTGGGSFSYVGSGISAGDRNCFLPPYLISPDDSNLMLYATHRIYRSTSGGTGWSPISGDLTGGGSAAIRTLAMAPSNPDIVYAATNDGRVLRSDDAGVNFDLIAQDVPGWPRVTREIFVHPNDPNTAYLGVAYFGETQLRRTTDGGQSWQALDASFPDIPVNTVAVDVRGSLPVIYAGADDGLYRSANDGGSWSRYGVGLPHAAVIDLLLEPARDRIIVATQGRGAWQIPIGIPGDCDCDGDVDYDDIDYFVAAIGDEQAWKDFYAAHHGGAEPPCHYVSCDANGDGNVDYDDIDPFVELLSG